MRNREGISFMRTFCIILFALFIHQTDLLSQQTFEISPELLSRDWAAKWIAYPDHSREQYGVYLFRKEISIESRPERFIVHVSADNRYKLFVNGVYVCNGPARSYLLKWNFESIDISSYLVSGRNVIAAMVWNFGPFRPIAQISGETGFLLQGNSKIEEAANSDSSWLVFCDEAYKPLPVVLNEFYAAGAGEEFDCEKHPWNWMDIDFKTDGWKKAIEVETAKPVGFKGDYGIASGHLLLQRQFPFMAEIHQQFFRIRRSDISGIPETFLIGSSPITIPARSRVVILLDQNEITTAYPLLNFSKGRGSVLKLTYAESLFDTLGNKGNRNDIENKKILGNSDKIIADGGIHRIFQTLFWRTFRYVQLEIETNDDPLVLNSLSSIFAAYPFEEKASFSCEDPVFRDIWNVGWRTQRLCSNETFFDCPYYEQLQYIGDTRIQALVSTYVSGDSRLMKNAISAFHDSRLPTGITQSRFPSNQVQIIPPFSLVWVTMVYDYWMLHDDSLFVRSMIPGILETLNWFENHVGSNGMLGPVEGWAFADWVESEGWKEGCPPDAYEGNSSVLSLQYVYTLEKASKILDAFNMHDLALQYRKLADHMIHSVYQLCFDQNKGLIADAPDKNTFSQHANIFALLTETFPENADKAQIIQKIIKDKELAPATLYFKFYLFEALELTGQSNQFTGLLLPWKQMLDLGLTTFAEKPDPVRSDCHAWSASPVYYFLSLVAGIKPAEPGFKSVRIEPNPGILEKIDARMPHRMGTISVMLEKNKQNQMTGEIILPQSLNGVYVWDGKELILHGGINKIH